MTVLKRSEPSMLPERPEKAVELEGTPTLKRIKKAMEQRDIGKGVLAGALGIPRGVLIGALKGHPLLALDRFVVLCRVLDLDAWTELRALGLEGDEYASILSEEIESITGHQAIDEYLRQRHVASSSPAEEIREALKERYDAKLVPVERGCDFRMPYHTYVRLRATSAPDRPIGATEQARRHLVIIRDLLCQESCQVYVHVETSLPLLRELGLEGELVLIVEDAFANKGVAVGQTLAESLAEMSPILVFGAYYSGAKDIAVMLHRTTGFAAVDVSRCVAEKCVNARALRTDVVLPELVFRNATRGAHAQRLILTMDDAAPLGASKYRHTFGFVRRQRDLKGTSVFLEMSNHLLLYSGYHIARTRAQMDSSAPPTHHEIAESVNELRDLQDALRQRSQLHKLTLSIPIELHVDVAKQYDRPPFPDAVDMMFDVYASAAETIREQLIEASAARFA